MTGAEFGGVDIDLLADYVGGALDGTPDEAVVAALIAEDPSWRDAHALLSGGVATVSTRLQSLGAVPEPMPVDVIARLDAALSQAGTAAEPETPSGGVAPVRRLAAVRENRLRRWAAPVGIAAAVLAFAGFGVQQLAGDSADRATSSSAGEAQVSQQDTGGTLALPAGPGEVTTSGTNYSRRTLGQAGARALEAPREPAAAGSTSSARKAPGPSPGLLAEGNDPLGRLRAQEALLACIDAIAAGNGAGAVTAQAVDYARFEGFPAVIVQFTAANGTWVWAVGAECGATGGDADRLDAVKVG